MSGTITIEICEWREKEAEMDRLRSALEPFSDYAREVLGAYSEIDPDHLLLTDIYHNNKFGLRVKHLLEAREALGK